MTRLTGDPVLVATVHRMITAVPAPTLELGRTFAGEPYVRIVSAPAGRGKQRERFVVVAPTLGQLFTALGGVFGSEDERLGG